MCSGKRLVSSRGFADWESVVGMLVSAVGSVLPSALGSQERQDYQVEALHLEGSKHFPSELILQRAAKQESKRDTAAFVTEGQQLPSLCSEEGGCYVFASVLGRTRSKS